MSEYNEYNKRRKKQLDAIPHELVPCKGDLDAYYYGFDRTGCDEIDRILSAVAAAGCSSHHTQEWDVPGTARHDSDADLISLVDVMQEHANRAAAKITELQKALKQLQVGDKGRAEKI